ncbi:glycosyltransferase family 4 protein [Bacteroidales bacterium OttesenSCG-928-A17]|nr:glycosyltransferase family 4 protein [Bacteroidales bacterium OttesenSCG-928-A17]
MKNKKCLCIDVNSVVGLFVRGYLSGIGRTTLDLMLALGDLKDELPFEIVLYSQNMKGIGGRNLNLPFKNKHLYLRNNEKYNKILQKFPIREWLTGYDLMHIPHNFEYVRHPEKCIVTLHDALFMKIQEKMFNHDKMKKIVPPFIRQSKAVITCSENSKRDIIETMNVSPDKIHVIPWGIRHDVFFPEKDLEETKTILQNKFKLDKPYFLSVSCNEERKNTPRLIDVFVEYTKQDSDTELCLIWNNIPDSITERINNLGMKKRIHILSNVTDEDLRLLYNGAKATVFPSFYEGFGLPVLESMACGTPVICSNTSSLPEVGKDAAIYIDPANNQSILDALIAIDIRDQNALIEKGLKYASEYTWEKCARETIKVYEKYLLNN